VMMFLLKSGFLPRQHSQVHYHSLWLWKKTLRICYG
jgi:hypothetical protein